MLNYRYNIIFLEYFYTIFYLVRNLLIVKQLKALNENTKTTF